MRAKKLAAVWMRGEAKRLRKKARAFAENTRPNTTHHAAGLLTSANMRAAAGFLDDEALKLEEGETDG